MRFFVSGDFSTVGIGHRFALQGGFKTFFDKTLLELLDFFWWTRHTPTQWLRLSNHRSHRP